MKNFITHRGGYTRSMKPFLLSLFLMLGLQFQSEATHFRYHSTSWSIGTNDTVIFQIAQSWRWSAFGNPALNTNVSTGTWNFGDNSAASISLQVTSINSTEDWFTGVTTIKKKYGTNGTYVAFYSDCCRISTLLDGNNDLSEIVRTQVTLGGSPQNNSPVSLVPAMVNFQLNALNTFSIPGFDPDGDALTYSITPGSQSGLNVASPAGLTLSPSGTITWTPTTSGLRAMNVTITDSKGDYTQVDFILRVSSFTSNPPTYDYTVTPANNFIYSVNPGTPINFNVKADDVDAGAQVVLTASGVPSGAVFTPALPTTPANPANTSFSWTPGSGDIGSYIIAFTATDNNSQQAITNIFINVNTNPVFDVPPSPPAGSGFCLITGNSFSQVIQASNLQSAVDVSITSMTGLPATATNSPALPTTPATLATTTLNWTPSPSEWGPHVVTYTAIDANNKSATHSYNLLVNTSPSFTSSAAPSTVTVGASYSHLFTAVDPNTPYGDVLEYHVTGLPTWLTLTDNNDGTATLTGTPGVGDVGTYTFDIHLEDIYHHCGPAVEETVTITVSNCTPINVSVSDIYACPGAPIQLNGSPAGGYWDLPNPYNGPSSAFTYYYMDANGCTGSATGNIYVGQAIIVNVSVTNITGISASVNYQGVVGIGWYDLRWRAVGATSWINGTNSAMTTKLLTGLTPNTAYEVQVRGFCSMTSPAGPWTTVNFSTNNLCNVPSGLFVTNVSSSTAKLNWAPVSGVAFYTVRWKPVSGTIWTSSSSMSTSKVINGLMANTAYEFQVRSHCGSSAGVFSASSNFSTAASKDAAGIVYQEVSVSGVKVYPNPTQGECNIEFKAELSSVAVIKILDISGRVVLQQQVDVEEGINLMSIDFSNLTQGMYHIQVEHEGVLKATAQVVRN